MRRTRLGAFLVKRPRGRQGLSCAAKGQFFAPPSCGGGTSVGVSREVATRAAATRAPGIIRHRKRAVFRGHLHAAGVFVFEAFSVKRMPQLAGAAQTLPSAAGDRPTKPFAGNMADRLSYSSPSCREPFTPISLRVFKFLAGMLAIACRGSLPYVFSIPVAMTPIACRPHVRPPCR